MELATIEATSWETATVRKTRQRSGEAFGDITRADDEVGPTTNALPPDYAHVKRRLFSFVEVPFEARRLAWGLLLKWRRLVADRDGVDLSAPWVFANEENIIEFEWHLPEREFVLVLLPDGPFEYLKSERVDGEEIESEGTVRVAEVRKFLAWVSKL